MRKKLNVFLCAVLITLTMLPTNMINIAAKNTNKVNDMNIIESHFKSQLDNNSLIFYSALESLYKEGKMKTGVGSYDLSTSFSQDVLNVYANGNNSLAIAFQSARDAFIKDYPEIFYVDFTKVTLRLGMKNNTYVMYLNNGSNENYYAAPFTTQEEVEAAIVEVDAKKKELIAGMSATTLENPASIVSYIHNKLIETAEFAYPTKETRYVSTVYGTLVKGLANCDGYSRTFKWILDDYNIENILVAGVGKNALYEENDEEVVKNTMNEYHQWNYVKLDGKWYGVDVTWDDPMKVEKAANNNIRTTYLLRGSDMLNENHFPLGLLSEGSQEFKYPELDTLDYGVLEKDENIDLGDVSTDLKVYVSKVEYPGQFDDVGDISKGTRFIVNYKNMTYEQLKEEGLYVAVRFGLSNTDFAPWELLDAFENDNNMDPKNLFDATVFTKTTMQFCLTKVELPKGDIHYGELDLAQEGNHVILTEMIDAPYYQNFTPPPFIRTSSPALTTRISPTKTHYAVEYYEELEVIDENKEVSIKINNSVSHIDAKVENIKLSNSTYKSPVGKDVVSTIIEFDFTPDSSFQGYANVYNLEIENMRGVKSKKTANQIPIVTTYETSLPCTMCPGPDGVTSAFVISNPVLVTDEDMSENMFVDKDGNELKYGNLNIALVATKTTGNKKDDLDKALGDIITNSSSSSTYELNLGCGSLAAALKPGYHVSVGVPYPEGFHPGDFEDVEFRAYHFKMVDGEWVSEEIVCQITPQGLMIIADSFSPFTIVAFEKEKAPESKLTAKTVNVSSESTGGKIITDKGGVGTYAIDENGSRTFTVTADEGYVIDKIVINNTEMKVADNTKYTATFNYNEINENNDMKVYFVAKKVIEIEKEEKVEAITPVVVPDEIKDSTPIYVEKSLSAPSIEKVLVKLSGILLQDASLSLSINELSDEANSALTSYTKTAEVIASGNPKLSISNAFNGKEVTYEIPVDENAGALTFLTYNATSKNYTKKEVQANNGVATITTTDFFEFALISELANKTELEKQILLTESILANKDKYVTSSIDGLSTILTQAKIIFNDKTARQDKVEAATKVVFTANMKARLKADTKLLQSAYDKAMKLDEETYTTSSWTTFQSKLTAAKTVLDNEEATQAEVDAAVVALTQAQTPLATKVSAYVWDSLTANIAEYRALEKDYTEAEFAKMKAALKAADAVVAKGKDDISTQEAAKVNGDLLTARLSLDKNVSVDEFFENLKLVIEIANDTLSSDEVANVRPGQIKALENAVKAGQALIDANSSDKAALKAATLKITKATQELYDIVEKVSLTSLIEVAEELKAAATYTPETLAALEAAMSKAQAVVANGDATEAHVKEAYSALETAIKNLEKEVIVNKDALAAQIEFAKSVIANKDNYVASTIKGLAALLAEVEAVYNNEDATQAEVNAATKAITTANMKARVKADKVALADIIAKVNAMDLSKYTEASVKALQEVAAKAQKVMDNEAASQIEIDASIKNVEAALQSLEVKANGGSGSTSGNTTGGTNTKDTTNKAGLILLMGLAGSIVLITKKRKSTINN